MTTFGFSSTGDEVVKHFRDRVAGKTILITGASEKGLGAETALSLAKGSPSQLILLARSQNKVDPVIKAIKQIDSNIESIFIPIELDKISSVSSAVEKIKSIPSIKKIDILINNAGIMAVPYGKNDAGIEQQLATNHIGHYYLTKQLLPLILTAGPGSRIVNLTSDGYMISPFRFTDPNFSDGKTYDIWSGYGQSKTANILFTKNLASKLASKDIQSFAVHPGVIMSTSLSNSLDRSEFANIAGITERNTGHKFEMGKPKEIQQGVSTTLVAALDPSIAHQSGAYLNNCTIEPTREYASSPENVEKLWELSEKLTGEKWDLG